MTPGLLLPRLGVDNQNRSQKEPSAVSGATAIPTTLTWPSTIPQKTCTHIETLQRQIVMLEQRIVELTKVVEERDRDLAAARAANRELMIRVNSPATRPG